MNAEFHPRTIAVATDFSDNAEVATTWATEIARRHAAKLVLLHAMLPETPDLAVVDVSFISLAHVLPAVAHVVAPGADVVALYLLTEANEQLRPKLERELKPGARVVSLEFRIKGWKPARVEKVEAHRHPYTIYLYHWPQK